MTGALRFVIPVCVAIAGAIAAHWLFGYVSHALQALQVLR